MKTVILLIAFLISDKYTEQMTKNIGAVYKAATIEELQQAVNAFERIANAEKVKWEPHYYASFGYVMMATREKDSGKKDAFLDQAKASIDKALAINPDESESVALEGFIHMIRVTVDPAARGPQYSMMAMQSYGKAMALNPKNPRALALMAQMQVGTAQFFKQEPTEGCATAKKAKDLFDSESPASPVAPSWGKGMNEELVKGCK